MAHKNNNNAKKKSQEIDANQVERKTTVYDDIESLQITFYEIESWIEKTTPILTRMTKELDKASGHFDKSKRIKKSNDIVDQQQLEQQLHQLQQQQLLWKKTSMLCNNDSTSTSSNTIPVEDNSSMQWLLSFQPGNLLRLDTNIKSVEQLIDAVTKIRLIQQADQQPMVKDKEQQRQATEEDLLLCSSPASSATSTSQPDVSYVEYWFHALGRRPYINLENYKHCRMNLSGLTKNISPKALTYIGQVTWDCLYPKYFVDWTTFWESSGDSQRNQVVVDSGLAMIFLHIMRHDKDICHNAQEIAGFYYDRSRDELMEFFDAPPDCDGVQALINLSLFCMVCKRYSQARIYIGVCLHMIVEMNMHRPETLSNADILLRKKYYKLLLCIYFGDYNLATFIGEPPLIVDREFNIDFYELVNINDRLVEMNKTATETEIVNFDNNKTIVKESYFVHTVELAKISKCIHQLIAHGASKKELLTQELALTQWLRKLPDFFKAEKHDYDHYEGVKKEKDRAVEKDITSVVDAETLEAQAALMLKIQFETQWIILHKAILTAIRQQSPPVLEEETRSSNICSNSADSVVAIAEVITRCFGWCVCQQMVTCIYHASTVYCGLALVKSNLSLRNKAKEMIHRIMRILEAGGANHEGFPDDMTECLCEFLSNHGMHNDNVECSCSVDDPGNTSLMAAGGGSMDIIPTIGPLDGVGIIENALRPRTHKHLKKLRHLSSMVIDDQSTFFCKEEFSPLS